MAARTGLSSLVLPLKLREAMKVVAGLGNPGNEYRNSRHNVGFLVMGELARRYQADKPRSKFEAEVVELLIGDAKVMLLAPQTYMNRSGRSIGKVVDFYRLPLDDLLVVCDDMNLKTGRLRLRGSGSAGGQKGLQDTINHLGTQEFARLRVGIGRPPGRMDPSDYVLARFSTREQEAIEDAVARAADGVETWIREGLTAAMNRINGPAESD